MSKRTLPKISFIGSGSVGTALASAFHDKGYSILSVINRSGKSAIALARSVKCKKASTLVSDINPKSDMIFITVPDHALKEVVLQLSKLPKLKWNHIFVAHTSGAYSSEILSPLEKKGALVASLHPIQTFPRTGKLPKLRGIYFGIEGSPQAAAQAEELVHTLQAHSLVIPAEKKPLYHIACVFASGYLVTILNAIDMLSKHLQMKASWTEVFGPLMTASTENAIKTSAANALTGPVMRYEVSTLTLHLETLQTYAPQFLPLYTVAGIEMARVAVENGKLSRASYQEILTLFKDFIKMQPNKKSSKED